ncbi:MAG: serpin family protein [Planctomycetes bacterium]|nr:serpin family protein [Planctomycetota bacterium]
MKTTTKLLPLALAICGLAVMQPAIQAEKEPAPSPASKAAKAGNATGTTLLASLFAKAPTKNHFVSPYSLHACLTLLRNGATGDTRAELDKALSLSGMPEEEVQASARALREAFAADNGVTLETANALWTDDRAAFLPDYVKQQQDVFGAEVATLDFEDPATLQKINKWADEKTHGKITKLFDELSDSSVMVLANAIYFKGTWQDEFDKKQTFGSDFTTAAGASVITQFMRRDGTMKGAKRSDLMAVSLPYTGGKTSMLVMLPAKGTDMGTFVKGMTPEFFSKLRGELRDQDEDAFLMLPRFKVECTYDLIPALQAAGINSAFTGKATFDAMSSHKPLFVGNAVHRTFVEVNEEGTAAAAVTAMDMSDGKAECSFEFMADRPFAYAIIHEETGAVMFLGVMNDPTAK